MRQRRAFTLVELLVVMAIIGLLIALLVPTVTGLVRQSRLLACRRNLYSIHTLLMAYAGNNEGFFPPFHEYYGAMIFHPASRHDPYGVTMSDVVQLKRMGGTAEMFFCPLDAYYGVSSWRWNTWSTEQYSASIGYAALINRQQTWTATPTEPALFTDGRASPATVHCEDDLPLMADNLRFRSDGWYIGWHHGDEGGFVNHSCHTLFRGGYVVYSDWSELQMQGPGLVMGAAQNDMWWFWLGHDNRRR